jgi:HK97 family phage portal protein
MNFFGKLLTKLGATPPPEDDFWYRPVNGTMSSVHVGKESALRLGAYSACVRVIAETLASLDITVYQREGKGRIVAESHPLQYLLRVAPNDYMTAFEFWELCGKSLLTWGNFYAEIQTDERDNVRALYPIPPQRMNVTLDPSTGLIVYTYTDRLNRTHVKLADDILHVPGLGYDGIEQIIGYSPVEMYRQSIGMSVDAETYGARFFANNATPTAYIASKQVVKDEQKNMILNYFYRQFGGTRNAGKLAFLEGDMELKTVATNHRDLQFLELRKFQVEEMARLLRVPLHLIQSLDRSTNNNIEHQGIDFATYTMTPWCERIEKRIDMQLLGPREGSRRYVKFELDSLLRGDAVSRAEYYAKRITAGNMTPNEARIRENDNPLAGGDQLYIQGAMVPLEMAGQQQAAGEVIQ